MDQSPNWPAVNLAGDNLLDGNLDTRKSSNKSAWMWAASLALLGGILQGVGLNIQRFTSTDLALSSLSVLICGALSAWFVRRLGWWLILYLPAIWLVMAAIALPAEVMTAGVVSRAADAVGPCSGWQELNADLSPISAGVLAFNSDVTAVDTPRESDYRRWAESSERIGEQYEGLSHPSAFTSYVELAARAFHEYEQGYAALSEGDDQRGIAFLDQGDRTVARAQSAFRSATAKC